MKSDETTRRKAFDEALRRSAERPPKTPPQFAARQVIRRLDEKNARPAKILSTGVLRPALTFAAALLFAVVIWQGSPAPNSVPDPALKSALKSNDVSPSPQSAVSQETDNRPTLDDNVVVIRLDEKTQLYMSLESPQG